MKKTLKKSRCICILMATYNGEKYLAEQLISIEKQNYTNWKLIISDDGSNDHTVLIAREFQDKWGASKLEIRQGPRKGYCQNFLSMASDTNIRSDLYAFSDQDDVWLPDKLERASGYFNEQNENLPTAYGSRTEIVDEQLRPIGFSPKFNMPSSFRNALVQSISGGNTQVFNNSTKHLFEVAGMQQVVSHDWWLYQIVQGAGGIFYYDSTSSLLYRQHSNALIGANSSLKARVYRITNVLNGRFKNWNDINYTALCNIRHLLTEDNQDILDLFGKFRTAQFLIRIRLLAVSGLYRQTWQGTLSLWLAAILNKI